tara:strand:+ start:106 stop:861 length:756 start_codon:yes stop_codon:yes gene_type:complete
MISLKIYKSRYQIIRQIMFIIKKKLDLIFYKFSENNKDLKNLINDGYIHLENQVPLDFLKEIEKKYHKFNDNDEEVVRQVDLEEEDLERLHKLLFKNNIISLIKSYLGRSVYTFQNVYHFLTNKKSSDSSWQPHHDTKFNRLKIYIWISNNTKNTHPIFYLKKSHLHIKTWLINQDTRYPENKKPLDEVFGKPGDIIIFDSHGIHSNFKNSIEPRKTIVLTFESVSLFSRINPFTKKGKNIIKELKAKKIS